MRRVVLTLAIVTAVACGSGSGSTSTADLEATTTGTPTTTTTPPTTTTTAPTTTTLSEEQIAQAELEADTQLIANLYRNYSDSWFQGVEAGYQFMAAHNHPSMGCTVDEFRAWYEWAEGSADESIVHQDTIQRQDGWILPDTKAVPEGRIYVYQITETTTQPGYDPVEKLQEVHAAILDGEAFFFIACRAVD